MKLHVFTGLLAVAVCGSALAADKKDGDRIQGTWMVIRGEDDGKGLPASEVKGTKVTITADTITVDEGKEKRVMNYKLDPSAKPHGIDLTTVEGSDKGKTALGIYDLDGDRLRICFAPPGQDRPKDFLVKAGSKEMRFVMRRAKG